MILDRYLVHEVTRPFMVVAVLLLSIFTTFSLGRFLVDANAGLLRISEVVELTALKSLIALEVLLPLGFYLAVMIGLGRLYNDSEIHSMRTAGISERRLLKPIINLAFALALLIGVFSIMVRPWAYEQVYRIKAHAQATTEVDRIKSSRFYVFEEANRTVYIERISGDGGDLHGIFIRTRQGQDLEVITAPSGRYDYRARPSHHRVRLMDTRIFKKVQDGPDLFARLGTFTIWLPTDQATTPAYYAEAVDTETLRQSAVPEDRAEYQWRLSTPVSTLLLALLAVPLSRSRPRQGRYARLLLAVVVYAVYFSVLDINRNWVQQETSNSIWWVPVILALAVLALYVPWRRLRGYRSGPHA